MGARGVLLSLFLMVCASVLGQIPTTQPVESLELRMLRSQVAHLQERLDSVTRDNARLRELLASAGISEEPQKKVIASPADAKRVVLVVDYRSDLILREAESFIAGLRDEQWFNVVTHQTHGMRPALVPAFNAMQRATQANRDRALAHVRANTNHSDPRACLLVALRFRPEAIAYIGGIPNLSTVEELQRENRTIGASIYTTVAYAGPDLRARYALWKLAAVTGGRCIDADGDAIDEPPLPIEVPSPVSPPPATRPSLFSR